MSLFDLGNDDSVLEKYRRRHYQNGRVHDQRTVESNHGVGQVIAAGFSFF